MFEVSLFNQNKLGKVTKKVCLQAINYHKYTVNNSIAVVLTILCGYGIFYLV